MANLSPQEEQRIRDNVKRYGVAVHNPNGWVFKGSVRAKAYNAAHGTRIVDDETLDFVLKNENEMRSIIEQLKARSAETTDAKSNIEGKE